MNVVEILKAAKAKIATPETWTQFDYAKDVDGYSVDFTDPDAVCFCSLGAVQTCTKISSWDIPFVGPMSVIKYLIAAVPEDYKQHVQARRSDGVFHGFVAGYNDKHTHAEVMALWDKAIELAEKDEKNEA